MDLRNDAVFKMVFADAPELLTDLINAVRYDEPPIKVVRILNPQIDPKELGGKLIVLDLLVRDAAGHLYNVELQVRRRGRWSPRSTYYLARTLSNQIGSGEGYVRDGRLPAVVLGRELVLHIVELPKADRLGKHPAALPAWITCFQHSQEDARMDEITHPPVRQALERLKVLQMDDEARRLAFVRQLALMDEAEALKEAREEGLQKGQASLLEGLLIRKFGPLPESVTQRLRSAPVQDLEAWGFALIDAATLDDVFTTPPASAERA
ncbi:PD-(D/E)XK nuclease family transposase [Pigmentiphaga soli]